MTTKKKFFFSNIIIAECAFLLVELEGRGRGLVAAKQIKQGEIILKEEPLLLGIMCFTNPSHQGVNMKSCTVGGGQNGRYIIIRTPSPILFFQYFFHSIHPI